MDLYKELLIHILAKQEVNVYFPHMYIDAKVIVEMECYKALEKIKSVIRDDRLTDEECFMKIEEIVCILEETGSGGGCRHDFG